MLMNNQGGAVPQNKAERERAKKSDLGTLPKEIKGTNCANCRFVTNTKKIGTNIHMGHCSHPQVDQIVTSRMCCAFWDNSGFLRAAETKP